MTAVKETARARRRRGAVPDDLIAAIYARQSLTRNESESREAQVEAGYATTKQYKAKVAAVLIEPDSTSGYKNRGLNRPEWKELLRLVETGEVNCVFAYKTDRLSRGGGPGWAPLLEAAETAGLDLDHFVLTPSGFMSEFEIGIRATMDREESKKTGDRISDMKYRQALKGEPTGGGRRAYGYTDRMFREVDEDERRILLHAKDRVLRDGMPWQTLAKELNRMGVRRPGTTGPWTGQKIGGTLRGPYLAGYRVVDGKYVQGTWEPIFTLAEHEALKAAKGVRWERSVSRHLLTGILRCGSCDSPMRAKPHCKWGLRYECRRRSQQLTGENVTGCVTISGLDAEYVIVESVLRRLDSPAVRAAVTASSQTQTARDLTTKMVAAKEALDEATDDYYATPKRISRDQFLQASERLNGEIEDLAAKISRQRVGIKLPSTTAAIRKAYAAGDLEFKRALISAVVQYVTVLPAKPQGQAELPIVVPGKASGRPVDAARIVPTWVA